ncbi:unnamed protein product, partial [Polarella glacialis]
LRSHAAAAKRKCKRAKSARFEAVELSVGRGCFAGVRVAEARRESQALSASRGPVLAVGQRQGAVEAEPDVEDAAGARSRRGRGAAVRGEVFLQPDESRVSDERIHENVWRLPQLLQISRGRALSLRMLGLRKSYGVHPPE